MQDLEKAKKRLTEKDLTLSIVKNGETIFETASHGISGFLTAMEKFGDKLEGASVADRVAGKAIALLCVYSKVKAVYAATLSKKAKAVLEENAIYHEWNELVENILNTDSTGVCPFEKLATEISNPNEAYAKLKALQESLACRDKEASTKHEQFISEEDADLKHIREKMLKQLVEKRERKQEMSTEPAQVTDSNFDETVNKNTLALIDCWAPWCGPCLALGPIIEEVAGEYAGKLFIGKLNVDENPQTAERFQIFSIPTMLIMKNGREADRIVGLVAKKTIEGVLKKHLG